MTFAISLAASHEADAIAKVHVQGWQETYRGIFPDEFLDSCDQKERAKKWRTSLGNSDQGQKTFLAKLDEKIVGFIDFGPVLHKNSAENCFGEIYALYLLRAFQGKGIGKALFEKAIDTLSQENLTPIQIICHTKNIRAKEFYKRRGAYFLKHTTSIIAGKNHVEDVFVFGKI